jgi:hypothetical protein
MDKLEYFGHILVAALAKARELGKLLLAETAKERRAILVKLLQKHSADAKHLAEATKHNGFLDEVKVTAALDRMIRAAEEIDNELEQLLAAAKKR